MCIKHATHITTLRDDNFAIDVYKRQDGTYTVTNVSLDGGENVRPFVINVFEGLSLGDVIKSCALSMIAEYDFDGNPVFSTINRNFIVA